MTDERTAPRTHVQPGGQLVVSLILPGGRTLRVCGGRKLELDDQLQEWERYCLWVVQWAAIE